MGDGRAVPEMRWKAWGAKLGKYKFVLLVLAAGLLLLLLPSSGGRTAQTADASGGASTLFDLDQVERDMEQALSKVEGAGDVTVVLTLRSGSRQVLAQDTQTDQRETSVETSKDTVVLSKGSGVEEAVLLQEICPTYQGALIVCGGGDDPQVQLKLTQAVSALTGLSSDKISICKGK